MTAKTSNDRSSLVMVVDPQHTTQLVKMRREPSCEIYVNTVNGSWPRKEVFTAQCLGRKYLQAQCLVSGSMLDKGKEWRLGPPSFKAFRPLAESNN